MSSYSSGDSCSTNTSRRCSKMELNYEGNTKFCYCEVEGMKLKAPRMTSWTNDNPGRRFFGCINWKQKNCGFFEWYDEPMTTRAKDVIKELVDENLTLLNECKKMKKTTTIEASTSANREVEAEIAELWDELQQLKLQNAKEFVKGEKKTRRAYVIAIASWLLLLAIFFVF